MKKLLLATPLAATVLLLGMVACRDAKNTDVPPVNTLRVGIAPYQDMAMLTTYKQLGLDTKNRINLDLITMQWEDIIPSLASAGRTVDVGFGSLIEFLTKYQNINSGQADPLVYVYPAYVFKGGGFVSFNPKVPVLDDHVPPSAAQVQKFFSFRIGAQKNSMFDMLLFSVSEQAGIPHSKVRIIDTTMADGLLAAEAGSLDATAAGLTQRNEALERGGRIVVTMEKFGFADLTGIICKRSTVEARRPDIEKLIRIWFSCVNYVSTDLDRNLQTPIKYLSQKSSTQYTVTTYKRALEAEYLPKSVDEANRTLVAADGSFSISRISKTVANYLVKEHIAKTAPPIPAPLTVKE